MERLPSFTHIGPPASFPRSQPSPPTSPTFGRKLRHTIQNSRRSHSPFNAGHTTDHVRAKSACSTRMFPPQNPRAVTTAAPSRVVAPGDETSSRAALGEDRHDLGISVSRQSSWTFQDSANDDPVPPDKTSGVNPPIFRGISWPLADSPESVVDMSPTPPSPSAAVERGDTAAENATSLGEYVSRSSSRQIPSATSTLEYTGLPIPAVGSRASGGSSLGASYSECNRGLLESIDAVLGMGNCNPLLIAVSGHVKTTLRQAYMELRAHAMRSRADQTREHVRGLIKPLLLQKAKLFAVAVQLVLSRHLLHRRVDCLHTWRTFALKQVIISDHKEFSSIISKEHRRARSVVMLEKVLQDCIRQHFRTLTLPSRSKWIKMPARTLLDALARVFERRLSIGWRLLVAGCEYNRARQALVHSLAVASRPAQAWKSIHALVSSSLGSTPEGERLLSQSRHFSH